MLAGSLLWTIGGQGCSISSSDGVGTNAMFYSPLSITVSTSGIVYVADYTAIRKIDATTGPDAQSVIDQLTFQFMFFDR